MAEKFVPHRFRSHFVMLAGLTLLETGTAGQSLAFGQRYGSDLPPELSVVEHGVAGIDAFAKAGGRFTGQKNAYGQTAAMMAAASNAGVMEAFVRAGGTFTDDKDKEGRTAAMYAVNCNLGRRGGDHHDESIEAIAAFGRLGGKFTEEQDRTGESAAAHVISWWPVDGIAGFVRAGGHFDNQPPKGYTAGMFAVQHGVEAIHAFVAAGGKFDSQQPNGQTERDIAGNAGQEVLKAYEDAVRQQGGLIYMSSDDEFSALKNPEAIESFVKAGGKFDDQTDKIGWEPAMRAVQRGPDVLKAFATYGGRFPTQQDPRGETAETLARREDSSNGRD